MANQSLPSLKLNGSGSKPLLAFRHAGRGLLILAGNIPKALNELSDKGLPKD